MVFARSACTRGPQGKALPNSHSSRPATSRSLYDLGATYEEGILVKRDLQLSMDYYTMAALRGESQSVFEVGRGYYYGIGRETDLRLAQLWFARARELGTFEELSEPD
ncbi:MAG: hypothetical protein GKR94_27400 [Gammaproteobacteria bacterium]|nr:hypothetical protein [Gammaproteobacteria bacterium]